jgi:spermidine/putrescine-binding protein
MSSDQDRLAGFDAISRRALLGRVAVLAGTLAAPAVVGHGVLASSGEVNFMGFAGYDMTAVFAAFTAKTGIKVQFHRADRPGINVRAGQAVAADRRS